MIINDGDHDGPPRTITRDEFNARHAAMFDKLDTNHDGKLTPDEMMAGHHMMMMHHGGAGDHGTMDMPAPPPGGHMMYMNEDGPGDHQVRIEIRRHGGPDEMDANHDGRLSFEEFAAPMREVFDEMDANHDGFIDKAEQEAAHHHMHGDHHPDMPPPPAGH